MKAVIFDLDGVILDDEHLHFKAHKAALATVGIRLTQKIYLKYGLAVGHKVLYPFLSKRSHKRLNVEKVHQLKTKIFLELIKQAKPRENINKVVKELSKKYPLAIASTAKKSVINTILKKFKIRKYFKTVISTDDIRKSKPFPDIYFKAARKLKVNPKDCLVIEDSQSGLTAAKAAHMKVIAFPTLFTKTQNFSQADSIVYSASGLQKEISKYEKQIKAIGFDFDGTLIMSEEEKANIAEEIFKKHCGVHKGIRTTYRSLVGKGFNRSQKIEKIFKKCVGRKPTQAEMQKLNKIFSKEYEKRMEICPLAACVNVLQELRDQTQFMFLLSLENKTQVRNVAKHCKLDKYFDEILGGPKSKIENLNHVLKKHGIKPEEVIYIGDSTGDIIASKKLNIKVIGIRGEFNYQKIMKKLGADFTFSNLCKLPLKILLK